MMNHYQYKTVCQIKQEVLSMTQQIQVSAIHSIQLGLPVPGMTYQFLQKLHYLQEVLLANQIKPENFDLCSFASSCIQSADAQVYYFLANCRR